MKHGSAIFVLQKKKEIHLHKLIYANKGVPYTALPFFLNMLHPLTTPSSLPHYKDNIIKPFYKIKIKYENKAILDTLFI